MPSFKLKIAVFCLVVSTFCIPIPRAAAQSFTKVAESSAIGGLGLSVPSINNGGTVAFVDTTAGHTGLFTGTGGPLTTLDTAGVYSQYAPGNGVGLNPSISDNGRVAAVVGMSTTPQSIFSTNGGPLTTIATGNNTPISDGHPLVLSRPAIGLDGTVTFTASHFGGFPANGVFSGNGGSLTTVVVNASSTSQLAVDPVVSSNGAFLAYNAPASLGASSTTSILHNGTTTSVPLSAPLAASVFAHVAVNNSGMLAGTTIHGSGGGLMVGNGTSTLLTFRSSINDASSPFANFDAVSINNNNAIAFYATTASGSGIFAGASLATKIIATGDPLDGSTVSSLAFGGQGLNDAGDVTFWARLADGRQGVYVFVPVPEPSLLLVFSGAVGGLMFRRPLFGRRKPAQTLTDG